MTTRIRSKSSAHDQSLERALEIIPDKVYKETFNKSLQKKTFMVRNFGYYEGTLFVL